MKKKPPPAQPAQADHVVAAQLGGKTKLRVIEPISLPHDWEMRPGVPLTRAECIGGPRPCPWMSCRHHLWLALQQEQPGNPQRGQQGETTFHPSTAATCALDIADANPSGLVLKEVGRLLGVSEERARQIAESAIEKLERAGITFDARP